MGSHKFGRNKQDNVTPFRGVTYIHVCDIAKGKSLSLAFDEFIELCERKTEIIEIDRELKMVFIVSVLLHDCKTFFVVFAYFV